MKLECIIFLSLLLTTQLVYAQIGLAEIIIGSQLLRFGGNFFGGGGGGGGGGGFAPERVQYYPVFLQGGGGHW